MKITGFQLPFPQLASWIFEPSTVLLKPLTTLRSWALSELKFKVLDPQSPSPVLDVFFLGWWWFCLILSTTDVWWCLMEFMGLLTYEARYLYKIGIPSLKLTVRHLKTDGWKMSFLLGWLPCCVSFRRVCCSTFFQTILTSNVRKGASKVDSSI